MRVVPDNFWTLNLDKKNNYKYTHVSLWGGHPTILDSGIYSISDGELFLISSIKNNDKGLNRNKYYFKNVKIKSHQSISYKIKVKKFRLFGQRYLVISADPFNDSWIKSTKPIDNN